MSQVVITKAYVGQYPDPIGFEAGEPIDVGRSDPEFPEWHWCRNQHGKEGWVHHSYLSARQGAATGARRYSAKELTVSAGAVATELERVGGWLLVQLADGSIGWLPESHARGVRRQSKNRSRE